MLRLYFECRQNSCYPSPGGPFKQTAYCTDLFEFLDDVFAEQRARTAKKNQAAQTKAQRSSK
jgi:hypothetical protein